MGEKQAVTVPASGGLACPEFARLRKTLAAQASLSAPQASLGTYIGGLWRR